MSKFQDILRTKYHDDADLIADLVDAGEELEHRFAGLLTPEEHELVADLGEIWGRFCDVIADGPSRSGDLGELIFHVHALQSALLRQAAARAFPDRYRLLGSFVKSYPQTRSVPLGLDLVFVTPAVDHDEVGRA